MPSRQTAAGLQERCVELRRQCNIRDVLKNYHFFFKTRAYAWLIFLIIVQIIVQSECLYSCNFYIHPPFYVIINIMSYQHVTVNVTYSSLPADCGRGSYGVNCREDCGHCKAGSNCLATDGTCPNGCDRWYIPDTCNVYIGM